MILFCCCLTIPVYIVFDQIELCLSGCHVWLRLCWGSVVADLGALFDVPAGLLRRSRIGCGSSDGCAWVSVGQRAAFLHPFSLRCALCCVLRLGLLLGGTSFTRLRCICALCGGAACCEVQVYLRGRSTNVAVGIGSVNHTIDGASFMHSERSHAARGDVSWRRSHANLQARLYLHLRSTAATRRPLTAVLLQRLYKSSSAARAAATHAARSSGLAASFATASAPGSPVCIAAVPSSSTTWRLSTFCRAARATFGLRAMNATCAEQLHITEKPILCAEMMPANDCIPLLLS